VNGPHRILVISRRPRGPRPTRDTVTRHQAIALVIGVVGFVAAGIASAIARQQPVSGCHLVLVVVLLRGWPPGDVWLAV